MFWSHRSFTVASKKGKDSCHLRCRPWLHAGRKWGDSLVYFQTTNFFSVKALFFPNCPSVWFRPRPPLLGGPNFGSFFRIMVQGGSLLSKSPDPSGPIAHLWVYLALYRIRMSPPNNHFNESPFRCNWEWSFTEETSHANLTKNKSTNPFTTFNRSKKKPARMPL